MHTPSQKTGQVTWLYVPYDAKEYAKVHGARWSASARQWYVIGEGHRALSPFTRRRRLRTKDGRPLPPT